jgi:hypothetical protein
MYSIGIVEKCKLGPHEDRPLHDLAASTRCMSDSTPPTSDTPVEV